MVKQLFIEASEGGDNLIDHRSWTPDSDPEIKDLLRDTPEHSTPSVRSSTPDRLFTPGAARITIEAANEAVVERMQAVVEGLLPWL